MDPFHDRLLDYRLGWRNMGGKKISGIVVDCPFGGAYRFGQPLEEGKNMSVMCSLAVCKAQTGMCGHEKTMLSIALLAAFGLGAYFLIS
jgi:hypothetical protein